MKKKQLDTLESLLADKFWNLKIHTKGQISSGYSSVNNQLTINRAFKIKQHSSFHDLIFAPHDENDVLLKEEVGGENGMQRLLTSPLSRTAMDEV